MKLDELIKKVQNSLTSSDILPRVLPDVEVKRIIQEDAVIYFTTYEKYKDITDEDLYDDSLFQYYVDGLSKYRMGTAMGRLNFNMPGNFQYDPIELVNEGKDIMSEVKNRLQQ